MSKPEAPARLYTVHVVDRLWERYGLTLKDHELIDIQRACLDGRATKFHSTRNGGRSFYYRYRGVVLYPVLAAHSNILVTFNPPDCTSKGAYLRSARAKGRIKEKPATPKQLDGRTETRRPRTACQYLAEAMSEAE